MHTAIHSGTLGPFIKHCGPNTAHKLMDKLYIIDQFTPYAVKMLVQKRRPTERRFYVLLKDKQFIEVMLIILHFLMLIICKTVNA